MIGATASVGAASATRAWLGTRNWRWLTSLRLRAITIALIVLALLGSATLKGSTPPPRPHAAGHSPQAALSPKLAMAVPLNCNGGGGPPTV
jgi:hypothetical protein